jgi:hypothetical protein
MVASKAWSCEENNSKLNSSQLFIETVHDNDIDRVAGASKSFFAQNIL